MTIMDPAVALALISLTEIRQCAVPIPPFLGIEFHGTHLRNLDPQYVLQILDTPKKLELAHWLYYTEYQRFQGQFVYITQEDRQRIPTDIPEWFLPNPIPMDTWDYINMEEEYDTHCPLPSDFRVESVSSEPKILESLISAGDEPVENNQATASPIIGAEPFILQEKTPLNNAQQDRLQQKQSAPLFQGPNDVPESTSTSVNRQLADKALPANQEATLPASKKKSPCPHPLHQRVGDTDSVKLFKLTWRSFALILGIIYSWAYYARWSAAGSRFFHLLTRPPDPGGLTSRSKSRRENKQRNDSRESDDWACVLATYTRSPRWKHRIRILVHRSFVMVLAKAADGIGWIASHLSLLKAVKKWLEYHRLHLRAGVESMDEKQFHSDEVGLTPKQSRTHETKSEKASDYAKKKVLLSDSSLHRSLQDSPAVIDIDGSTQAPSSLLSPRSSPPGSSQSAVEFQSSAEQLTLESTGNFERLRRRQRYMGCEISITEEGAKIFEAAASRKRHRAFAVCVVIRGAAPCPSKSVQTVTIRHVCASVQTPSAMIGSLMTGIVAANNRSKRTSRWAISSNSKSDGLRSGLTIEDDSRAAGLSPRAALSPSGSGSPTRGGNSGREMSYIFPSGNNNIGQQQHRLLAINNQGAKNLGAKVDVANLGDQSTTLLSSAEGIPAEFDLGMWMPSYLSSDSEEGDKQTQQRLPRFWEFEPPPGFELENKS